MSALKPALLDMDDTALTAAVTGAGGEAYRAAQVRAWLLKNRDIPDMHNLPRALRERLAAQYRAGRARIVGARKSRIDQTEKLLFAFDDGNIVEGVLMLYEHGVTLCLSTQVGCRMGCAFCASTQGGLVRNLTDGEMLAQVIAATDYRGGGRSITNLVLMGSGEPLDNYDHVVRFIRRVSAPDGLGFSRRNLSLSTCGLVDQMRALAQEGLDVTLCLSLHSADNETRRRIMPAARAWSVAQTLDALREYVNTTGRRAVVEYALIGGVNDSLAAARQLAYVLRGLRCHVNLIPMNDVQGSALRASTPEQMQAFQRELERLGVSVTRRRTLGADIAGACGQLRSGYLADTKPNKEDGNDAL